MSIFLGEIVLASEKRKDLESKLKGDTGWKLQGLQQNQDLLMSNIHY